MTANSVRACIGMMGLLLIGVTPAAAGPITFDNIASSAGSIPAGYGGLVWSNFQIEDDADYMGTYGNSYGSPSGDYAAFNAFGLAAVELTASTGSSFTFGLGSFSSWADHDTFAPFSAQSLALIGYRAGDLADAPTYYLEFLLDPTMYITQQLGWTGLERLAFVSGDGVNFNVNGLSWLMDDLDVTVEHTPVPEPATLSLLGAGLLSLAMSRRRRRRNSSR